MKMRTPTLIQELDHCFQTTYKTRLIVQSEWPHDQSASLQMVESSDVPLNYLTEEFKDSSAMQVKPVSIRMLDMQWFYRGNDNFVAFSKQLENLPNSFYSTEFLTCLLEENWDEHRDMMVKQLFVPYILYAVCSIWYMKLALATDPENDD